MRPRDVALASLLAAALVSCAVTGDRVNPETPLWVHRPGANLQLVVKRTLTAPSRTVGEDWERGKAAIDPVHHRVFVGSADHGLYCLRAGDGSTIWRFETMGVVQSEPYYDAELDIVYFGSHDGGLYAVRAFDGSLVFRYDTGAEVARRPVRDGETLVFANGADHLFAANRRTGKPLWSAQRTPALGMEIAGHAGPAVGFGMVFIAYSDGHVGAYDLRDGAERWTPVDLSADAEQATGEAPRYLDVDTTPVLDDGPDGPVVYVASYAGGVVALDARSGSRVWSNDRVLGTTDLVLFQEPAHASRTSGDGQAEPLVPARKVLVASSAQTGLVGLDPATGRDLWRNRVPEGGITAPEPVAGALAVGTTRYGLFLVSPRDGKVIDGIDLGSGFAVTPTGYGTRLYSLTNAGTFVGLVIDAPGAPRSERDGFDAVLR